MKCIGTVQCSLIGSTTLIQIEFMKNIKGVFGGLHIIPCKCKIFFPPLSKIYTQVPLLYTVVIINVCYNGIYLNRVNLSMVAIMITPIARLWQVPLRAIDPFLIHNKPVNILVHSVL